MVGLKSSLDKSEAQQVIYDFFRDFQNWCSQSKLPNQAELDKHLAKNIQVASNGQTVSRNSAEYLNTLQKFQKKHSRCEMSKPLQDLVVCGNQATVFYKIDLTPRQGKPKQVFVMAIVDIDDHKITRWTQVAHELGTGDWDK